MRIDSSNYILTTALLQTSQNELSRKPLGTERVSGHLCPQSGYWQIANPAVTMIVNVKKGENMPFQDGKPVNWQLVEYDLKNEVEL